jgi:hypothetical protein
MRARPTQQAAERRIAAKYHKLHTPIVELVQALQDAIPPEAALGGKVELTQIDGHIEVAAALTARQLVVNDGTRRFTLVIEEVKK